MEIEKRGSWFSWDSQNVKNLTMCVDKMHLKMLGNIQTVKLWLENNHKKGLCFSIGCWSDSYKNMLSLSIKIKKCVRPIVITMQNNPIQDSFGPTS